MSSSGLEAAKSKARSMLEAGSYSIDDIVSETGLSRQVVLGMKGGLARASKKAKAKAEGEGGPPSKAEVPEEIDVLKGILIKFGVQEKRAEGIADLMSHAGWDNFDELRYYLSCAGVNPDRIILVLQAWSNHRGSAVPVNILQDLRRTQAFPIQQAGAEYVTKADLEAVEKEREERAWRSWVTKKLEEGSPKQGDEVKEVRVELKEVRKELEKTREEARKREVEDLKGELKGVREEIKTLRGSTSDLAVVVKEAKDLGEKWILHGGGPGAQVAMGALGYERVSVGGKPPAREAPPEARAGLIDEWAKRGLLVTVIDKNGERYVVQEGQRGG